MEVIHIYRTAINNPYFEKKWLEIWRLSCYHWVSVNKYINHTLGHILCPGLGGQLILYAFIVVCFFFLLGFCSFDIPIYIFERMEIGKEGRRDRRGKKENEF